VPGSAAVACPPVSGVVAAFRWMAKPPASSVTRNPAERLDEKGLKAAGNPARGFWGRLFAAEVAGSQAKNESGEPSRFPVSRVCLFTVAASAGRRQGAHRKSGIVI
jgi:hypothetical protein